MGNRLHNPNGRACDAVGNGYGPAHRLAGRGEHTAEPLTAARLIKGCCTGTTRPHKWGILWYQCNPLVHSPIAMDAAKCCGVNNILYYQSLGGK